MTTRESGKAAKYVEALNEARLEGNWPATGEPLRKIEKHAPGRRCLIVAAKAEVDIGSRAHPALKAAGNDTDTALSRTAMSLSEAIESEQAGTNANAEDVFFARVTRAHCLYLESHFFNALECLTPSRWPATNGPASAAMRLSLVKAKYIYGASLEGIGSLNEAAETYRSAIPLIEDCQRMPRQYKELSKWSNRILAQLCARASEKASDSRIESIGSALLAYRRWAQSLKSITIDSSIQQSNRQTWESYYRLVSQILHSNMVYEESNGSPLSTRSFSVTRAELSKLRQPQYEELSRVQASFEKILMKDTEFPKANQSNRQFEKFVDQAAANWRVITGIEWADTDIGGSGQVGCTLQLLDLLYKAASRTFHSTSVLRHLFVVHASLAEFDVALKAFDAYTEIISKGKARAEKTGKHEVGLDSDDEVLHTAAHAIKLLCLYGEREQIEKAFSIGQKIQTWLSQERPKSSTSLTTDLAPEVASERVSTESFSSSPALAAAYKGIGQSQACWARHTYDPELREELQDDAVRNLHKAFVFSQKNGVDLEIANLLAFTQAEKRQITPALNTIKTALAKFDAVDLPAISAHPAEIKFDEQRQRLPIVHLLVLLLGVRGDFEAALKVCESTIEDIVDWGATCDDVDGLQTGGTHNRYDISGVLPERLKQSLLSFEKETLLQIKVTEMELLILLENVSYAGSKRLELLKMYGQLFGNPSPDRPQTDGQAPGVSFDRARPGTVKSFRHGFLGRTKSVRRSVDGTSIDVPTVPEHLQAKKGKPANGTEQESRNITPVSLTVTNENGEKIHDEAPKGLGSRLSMSLRKGRHHKTALDTTHHKDKQGANTISPIRERPPVPLFPKEDRANGSDDNAQDITALPAIGNSVQDRESEKSPQLPHINGTSDMPTPPMRRPEDTVPLRMVKPGDLSISAPPPALNRLQSQVHHISILVQIWLFISGIYTKEDLYDEAGNAVDEAEALVELLKTETAAVESSARAWQFRGWGMGQSISRLTADVCAERGRIQGPVHGPHRALEHYERALAYITDHPQAVLQLSRILLDIYEEKIPAEAPALTDMTTLAGSSASQLGLDSFLSQPLRAPAAPDPAPSTEPVEPQSGTNGTSGGDEDTPRKTRKKRNADPSPAELNRIACRERAYLLLMVQSKMGESWDNSEVWFELSRAYELMGLTAKAEECLWWVVSLEDSRPLRPWSSIGAVF